MRLLDLFCGLKGWSEPFVERGHDVKTLDIEPRFDPTFTASILDWEPAALGSWRPDAVLASPPCHGFSVMNIGRNWNRDHTPKTDTAIQALKMVERTLGLLAFLKPRFFLIENPRAKLRKLPCMERFTRHTVTQCQYWSEGEGPCRMKPTDLWGGFPPSLVLKPICANGAPCHVSAPRGSTTGTQGMDSALAARIPRRLALDVCLALERDL